MSVARTPWLGSVVINDTAVHTLVSLLTSLAANLRPDCLDRAVARCQYLVITNDADNGSAKLYVGNELLSLTFYGQKLLAGQQVPFYSMDANLIRLDQISVMFDTTGKTLSLSILTR